MRTSWLVAAAIGGLVLAGCGMQAATQGTTTTTAESVTSRVGVIEAAPSAPLQVVGEGPEAIPIARCQSFLDWLYGQPPSGYRPPHVSHVLLARFKASANKATSQRGIATYIAACNALHLPRQVILKAPSRPHNRSIPPWVKRMFGQPGWPPPAKGPKSVYHARFGKGMAAWSVAIVNAENVGSFAQCLNISTSTRLAWNSWSDDSQCGFNDQAPYPNRLPVGLRIEFRPWMQTDLASGQLVLGPAPVEAASVAVRYRLRSGSGSGCHGDQWVAAAATQKLPVGVEAARWFHIVLPRDARSCVIGVRFFSSSGAIVRDSTF